MTYTYYVIKHVATGELMPQMKRGKGYTHWNPDTKSIPDQSLGIPRLFSTIKSAKLSIIQWASNPNMAAKYDFDSDYCDNIITEDGRSRSNLIAVEVKMEI
jgi:hypothetical protein